MSESEEHTVAQTHRVELWLDATHCEVLEAPHGATIREVLLQHAHSPYTRWTQRANCGGRGLCATCGVWLLGDAPEPTHWHDRAAARWGYPRLACQVRVEGPLVVRLVSEKMIWGGRGGPAESGG